jgi:hypothetical protein
MDSPYANYLIRQFVLAAITKIAARNTTSSSEQDRIAEMLAKYTTSPELELQQRAVEFASLFTLGELRIGVLEQMPPPELKATVMGVGGLKPSHRVPFLKLFFSQREKTRWFCWGQRGNVYQTSFSFFFLIIFQRWIFLEMKFR